MNKIKFGQELAKGPNFCILLSTYFSTKYLDELLNSIRTQSYTSWVIYWREDSSNRIPYPGLSVLQAHGKAICDMSTHRNGKNFGPALSFGHLLADAPDADYYLFCDHDDIWHKDKLWEIAKRHASHPSDVFVHNGIARRDGEEGVALISAADFQNQLRNEIYFQNFVPGCCIAVSHNVRKSVAAAILKTSSVTLYHDWITLHLAVCKNYSVEFIDFPAIEYRLHESNEVGLSGPFAKAIKLLKSGGLIGYLLDYAKGLATLRKMRIAPSGFRQELKLAAQGGFGDSILRKCFILSTFLLSIVLP